MSFSFAATLGGLKVFVRELLQELGQEGVLGNAAGFEALCLHETNVTARRCRCLWGVETVGLALNAAVVPLGRVFALESAQVKDAGGKWVPLPILSEAELDRWDDRQVAESAQAVTRWRNMATARVPIAGVWRDAGLVELVPPPSESRADSLQFRGWAEPVAGWASSDAASYPLAARFLPLTAYQVAIALVNQAGGDSSRLLVGQAQLLATLVPGAAASDVAPLAGAVMSGDANREGG